MVDFGPAGGSAEVAPAAGSSSASGTAASIGTGGALEFSDSGGGSGSTLPSAVCAGTGCSTNAGDAADDVPGTDGLAGS